MAVPESSIWRHTMWAVVPSVVTLTLLPYGDRLAWPVRRFSSLYMTLVPLAPMVGVLLWTMWAMTQSGDPSPLRYVPILNPLELTQGLSLVAALTWWTRVGANRIVDSRVGRGAIAAIAFLALNAVTGRIVHFYLGVPYEFDTLARSFTFQAGVSVLWGVTATSLMAVARRRADRSTWVVGATLLGALVLKLFVVDLQGVGGIARIVSFIVTGLLVLAVGYFSPAPPRVQRLEETP
jgi:uncharacterized membrane protein